jgi:acetyltransferase-like isoleucine patch superfamily enzyme
MYSAVYKDIPDEMIAMGNPARPMKRNEERRVFK